MHSAAAAKSIALFHTPMRYTLHLCAPPVWQYTLNATQPNMNQPTVPSLHQRARTPPHRFLKRTTQYLLNRKMTHCSTYTTPDLPPTLAAPLALCKAIHSNKYPTVKSSQPSPNIPLQPFLNKAHTQKPAASFHTLYTILPPFTLPPLPRNAQRCSCQIQCNV